MRRPIAPARFELADESTLFLDEIANIADESAGEAAARD